MIYFTSDIHFGHTNIIKYSKRPYVRDGINDVNFMNNDIINKYNSVVRPDDTVYILGDVSFDPEPGMYLSRMVGRKHLIFGNHDLKSKAKLAPYFESMQDYLVIKVNDPVGNISVPVVMFHYPIASWDKAHHGSWHLHGHSHGSYKIPYGRILDVGVDCNQMMPFSLPDVARYMHRREARPVDHHGA